MVFGKKLKRTVSDGSSLRFLCVLCGSLFDLHLRDTAWLKPQPKSDLGGFAALLAESLCLSVELLLLEALPRRRSRRVSKGAHGKAKPFRQESGKAAAGKKVVQKTRS